MRQVISLLLKVVFVFWLMGIAFCIISVRNPFWVHSVDARSDQTENLEDFYSETLPYVQIKHVDLEYTGFYSVCDSEIVSYCFVCTVGDYSYLAEVSARMVYEWTQDVTDKIEDVTLTGRMSYDNRLVHLLADEDGTDTDTYKEKYGISDICVLHYQSDQEQFIICYVLAALVGGIILTGAISTKQKKIRSAYEE